MLMMVVSPCVRWTCLHAIPVELCGIARAEDLEGAALAHRVRPNEDPVLPGRKTPEHTGFHRLATCETKVRLHAGERVGGHAGALFEDDADFVVPVDLVEGRRDEAERQRFFGAQLLADRSARGARRRLFLVEARIEPRQAVD